MALLEPISSCYVRVKLGDALGVRGVDRKPLIIAGEVSDYALNSTKNLGLLANQNHCGVSKYNL
jgi:hypothetical protein